MTARHWSGLAALQLAAASKNKGRRRGDREDERMDGKLHNRPVSRCNTDAEIGQRECQPRPEKSARAIDAAARAAVQDGSDCVERDGQYDADQDDDGRAHRFTYAATCCPVEYLCGRGSCRGTRSRVVLEDHAEGARDVGRALEELHQHETGQFLEHVPDLRVALQWLGRAAHGVTRARGAPAHRHPQE